MNTPNDIAKTNYMHRQSIGFVRMRKFNLTPIEVAIYNLSSGVTVTIDYQVLLYGY